MLPAGPVFGSDGDQNANRRRICPGLWQRLNSLGRLRNSQRAASLSPSPILPRGGPLLLAPRKAEKAADFNAAPCARPRRPWAGAFSSSAQRIALVRSRRLFDDATGDAGAAAAQWLRLVAVIV